MTQLMAYVPESEIAIFRAQDAERIALVISIDKNENIFGCADLRNIIAEYARTIYSALRQSSIRYGIAYDMSNSIGNSFEAFNPTNFYEPVKAYENQTKKEKKKIQKKERSTQRYAEQRKLKIKFRK